MYITLGNELKKAREKVLFSPLEPKGEMKRGSDFFSTNKYLFSIVLENLESKSLCRVSQCCWFFKQMADSDKYWKAVFFKEIRKPSVVPCYDSWRILGKEEDFKKCVRGEREQKVLNLIPGGRRFKYFYQLALLHDSMFVHFLFPLNLFTNFFFQSESALSSSSQFDLVFLPAGTYNRGF